jgi:hypothetical protein
MAILQVVIGPKPMLVRHESCGFLGVMSDYRELNVPQNDAEDLSRLLELELIQKRAAWKQAGKRNRSIRTAAFLFLFLLVAACLAGFFFAYTRVNEQRTNQQPNSAVAH